MNDRDLVMHSPETTDGMRVEQNERNAAIGINYMSKYSQLGVRAVFIPDPPVSD